MESIANFEEIDLQKHLLVLQRRWLPAAGVFVAVFGVAFLNALSLKPTYKAEGSLLIRTNRTSSLTGLGEAIGRIESLGSTTSPPDTQARIILSVPVIQKTITELNLTDKQGKPLKIADLTGKLKVENAKGTDVLQISYTEKDPEVAAKVVNKVVEVYIRSNIEANREETVSARKFILEELPATETSVREAESALRRFKERNKVIALEQEAAAAVTEIARLETQISETQAKLVDATARSQKLQNQAAIVSQQSVTFASLSQIPGIQQVLAQLQEAQSELVVMQTRFQAQHPTVVNLQERVAALNRLLEQRIQQSTGSNQQISKIPEGDLQIGQLRQKLIADFAQSEVERVGLTKQIASLSNKQVAYRERANVLPKLEQTQRQYERKLKASQTTYESLLTKLQEVQVAENQNIGNARVISPALIPDQPTASPKNLIIGGGGILGIALGVIAAFALDLSDRSVKTLKEAKDLFQYTPLGVIPSVSRSNSWGEVDRPVSHRLGSDIAQFPVGDAYQMLQANLKFLSSDKKLKAIAVTSSVSKEGKSEVSANLAVAMAEVGHRVLLVDADMRHPSQHHIWGLTNAVGLSNVMVDEVSIETAVQAVMSNLYVLPCGMIPPNPVALLDSKRMAALVATFIRNYDFVIFDTPALAGTADASVLGKLADGILLVVRPGVLDIASANAAKEFLTHSGQNVLGMVINSVNVKREPDSYFYYTREQGGNGFGSRSSIRVRQNLLGAIGRRGK